MLTLVNGWTGLRLRYAQCHGWWRLVCGRVLLLIWLSRASLRSSRFSSSNRRIKSSWCRLAVCIVLVEKALGDVGRVRVAFELNGLQDQLFPKPL